MKKEELIKMENETARLRFAAATLDYVTELVHTCDRQDLGRMNRTQLVGMMNYLADNIGVEFKVEKALDLLDKKIVEDNFGNK